MTRNDLKMTDDGLTAEIVTEALAELLSKVTPGPWTYELNESICSGYELKNGRHTANWIAEIDHINQDDWQDDGYKTHSPTADANAQLIALAPELGRAVLALRAQVAAAQELLASQFSESEILLMLTMGNFHLSSTEGALRQRANRLSAAQAALRSALADAPQPTGDAF